jgi:1,4-alpha-glucan branching enzyme
MALKIFAYDPELVEYGDHIRRRLSDYEKKRKELVARDGSLLDFANGHEYFGFHKTENGWYYREWAPAADEVYLTGDMVNWDKTKLRLTPLGNGVFEIFLPGTKSLPLKVTR